MVAQRRSIQWVASTHVANTCIVMPLALSLLVALVLVVLNIASVIALNPAWLTTQSGLVIFFLSLFGIDTLGKILGVYYSIGYLRKYTIIERPTACIMPAVGWFVALHIILFAANVARSGFDITSLVVFCVYLGLWTWVFWFLTKRGFEKMERQALAPNVTPTMTERRQRTNVEDASKSQPTAAPVLDPTIKLQKLKQLLDQGLITEEDYTVRKEKLLNEL
jgi:hypothetical protein